MSEVSNVLGVWSRALPAAAKSAGRASAIDCVYACVRGYIETGEIGPVARIPASAELASLWSMPVATVHKALHRLTQDGFLVRRRRLGTYVRAPTASVKTVGIYMPGGAHLGRQSFVGAACQALKEVCGQAGLQSELLVDPRADEAQCEPWRDLVRMAELGQVDAVVTPLADYLSVSWLDRLPVPAAYITSARTRHSVRFDMRSFGATAAKALVQAGCRVPGVVMVWSRHAMRTYGLTNADSSAFRAGLRAGFGSRTLSDDRIESLEGSLGLSGDEHAAYGYARTRALLTRCPDLDGLIVYPDSVAQGALFAVMERPVESRPVLLFHRNRELPFFCPLPVMWLESTAHDAARLLLDKVILRRHDAGKKERMIGFRLVADPMGGRPASGTMTDEAVVKD
jgi:DNA-binding LacI/PurR family transcriptional regulator